MERLPFLPDREKPPGAECLDQARRPAIAATRRKSSASSVGGGRWSRIAALSAVRRVTSAAAVATENQGVTDAIVGHGAEVAVLVEVEVDHVARQHELVGDRR